MRRAFRGVVDDASLARFSDFFTASVAKVGLAQATADLVDVTLTSPSYVFRDEVHTTNDGRLLPAQHAAEPELHARRLAPDASV